MFLKVFKTHERIEVLYGHFIDGDGTNVIETSNSREKQIGSTCLVQLAPGINEMERSEISC